MKERPTLFSGPMAKAILDGRKTVTRPVVKPQPHGRITKALTGGWYDDEGIDPCRLITCPLGQPGDRLWVRETWQDCRGCGRVNYRADKHDAGCICYEPLGRWRPSIFMRRCDSRITLEIVSVRVERLQEITGSDAKAEGIHCFACDESMELGEEMGHVDYIDKYRELWDSINGKKHPWNSNPWVWRLEFRRMKS
jgi:hypothetical protein